MVDYRTHFVALDAFRSSLAARSFPDAATAALRDEQLLDADRAPGLALLGSLVDHMIWHAGSDGTEIALLERASALWQKALNVYQALSDVRAAIEQALANPADPASVALFNKGMNDFQQLGVAANAWQGDIGLLRADVETLKHIPPHPRQEDQALGRWTWGDVFVARRTDAFTRSVRRLASSTSTSAFAFGTLSSYGANVCGSAYLGQVVGGPRRSHRFRDRLARNTVGSWFARARPTLPTLTSVANLIRFGPAGAPPTLPASIEALITTALTDTFDRRVAPPLPDVNLGYQRLVRHLELLDTFSMPPSPGLPINPFSDRLFGDPSNPYTSVAPQDLGSGTTSGSGGSSGGGVRPQNYPSGGTQNSTDSPPSAGDKCAAFCEWFFGFILFLAGGWAVCTGFWVQKKECPLWTDIVKAWNTFESNPQGPQVGQSTSELTSSGLQAASQMDQVTEFVGNLFELQSALYEALGRATDFLSVYGLIYPDGLLDLPRQQQFTSSPATPALQWPHLLQADAADSFNQPPSTGIEQPAVKLVPYAAGSTPDAFIVGTPGMQSATAPAASMALWDQMALDIRDSPNYDLDADRGLHHVCWAARGSIKANPIDVELLNYGQT
jgi:hypothetical protein